MKEKHKNYSEEERENINKNISIAVKNSPKAKKQRIKRAKLGALALKEYIKNLKGGELKDFKKKQREKNGINDSDRYLFAQYNKLVWYYTNQDLKELEGIELRSVYFHLDHKFSILEGFKEDISPDIIGSNINLEIIGAKENLTKLSKCSITKEELLSSFEKLIGD